MKPVVWRIAVPCVAALALAGCGGSDGGTADNTGGEQPAARPFSPLEFPFQNPADLVRVDAYGIPNWSGTEPHNGIDLILTEKLASSPILSPTAGTVVDIGAHGNPFSHPAGQLIVNVQIRVNEEWTVDLVLEPGAAGDAAQAAQLAAIHVQPGQDVRVGTPVADLLVGPLGHPHLHLMAERSGATVCPYAHSSAAARAIYEDLARRQASHMPEGGLCSGAPN